MKVKVYAKNGYLAGERTLAGQKVILTPGPNKVKDEYEYEGEIIGPTSDCTESVIGADSRIKIEFVDYEELRKFVIRTFNVDPAWLGCGTAEVKIIAEDGVFVYELRCNNREVYIKRRIEPVVNIVINRLPYKVEY